MLSLCLRVAASLRSNTRVLSLLQLAIFLSAKNPKVNQVKFPAHDAPNPQLDSNLYVNKSDLKTVYRQFMSLEGSATPPKGPVKEVKKTPVPKTAMVRPCACTQPLCAMASMPRAIPLMITSPQLARSWERRSATPSP